VPPVTQNNKVIRLKGKGMPIYLKHNQYGDMLIKIKVKLPTQLNDKEKELFMKLREIANSKTKSYV